MAVVTAKSPRPFFGRRGLRPCHPSSPWWTLSGRQLPKVVALAGVLVLSLACAPTTGTEVDAPGEDLESEGEASAVGWSIRSLERTAEACEPAATPAAERDRFPVDDCTRITLIYPEFVSEPDGTLARILNGYVRTSIESSAYEEAPATSPEDRMSRFLQDYAAFRRTAPDVDVAWAARIELEVIYRSSRFISLREVERWSVGGGHPGVFTELATFDLVTGEQLFLDRVLPPEGLEELSRHVEREFWTNQGLEEEDNRGNRRGGHPFELPQRFAVVEAGLLFSFNPYEVASNVRTPVEVEVGWDFLEELEPLSPLADLL